MYVSRITKMDGLRVRSGRVVSGCGFTLCATRSDVTNARDLENDVSRGVRERSTCLISELLWLALIRNVVRCPHEHIEVATITSRMTVLQFLISLLLNALPDRTWKAVRSAAFQGTC